MIISFLKFLGSSFYALTRQSYRFGDLSFRPTLCTQALKLALSQHYRGITPPPVASFSRPAGEGEEGGV
ncbi:MAG: hypothetical protein ACK5O9_01790, partial [Holosporales bacterium]